MRPHEDEQAARAVQASPPGSQTQPSSALEQYPGHPSAHVLS
ncbi:MAG TPA: hypothetical protein VFA10_23415 [Ktedonobacteraceae bacterium]|nr:hypothetical protein [Ktedonobacteraceae bacterium]